MNKICFTVSLYHASTCFQHHVLIVRRSKLYYTASGIITPIGGRPVHRLRKNLKSTTYLRRFFVDKLSEDGTLVPKHVGGGT